MKSFILSYKFNDIKSYFKPAFVSDMKTSSDNPWFYIIEMFDDFNKMRAGIIKSWQLYFLDESMSAFRPRTIATCNLPHLSCDWQKPEPLGSEFKYITDALLGVLLAIGTTVKLPIQLPLSTTRSGLSCHPQPRHPSVLCTAAYLVL